MKKLIKITSVALFIFATCIFINWCRKQDERRVKYKYIGTSIMETPNYLPENCTVQEMEFYESLHEIK